MRLSPKPILPDGRHPFVVSGCAPPADPYRDRVRTPPADLPERALSGAVEAGWSLRTASLTYRPVGFGSHHWRLTDVTKDLPG